MVVCCNSCYTMYMVQVGSAQAGELPVTCAKSFALSCTSLEGKKYVGNENSPYIN